MEESRDILMSTLIESGVLIPGDFSSVGEVYPEALVSICAQLLNLIDPSASLCDELPDSLPERFRICTDIAHSVKNLGYISDMIYYKFLHPSEDDSYRLVRFLVERLSEKNEGVKTSPAGDLASRPKMENFRDISENEMVYKLFNLGLLHSVYPSEDLEEMRHFPANLVKTIARFVKKTKSKKPLLLKVCGTTPIWDVDGDYHSPHQLIYLGAASEPPCFTKGNPLVEEADADGYRDSSILEIFKEIEKIEKQKKLKINYQTSRILMVSYFGKERKPAESERLSGWINGLNDYYLKNVENPVLMEIQKDEDVSSTAVLPTAEETRENVEELVTTTNNIMGPSTDEPRG